MAIPEFRDDGWLPEEHHIAAWEEISVAFGGEPGTQRRMVLSNLCRWRDEARDAGAIGRVILDGSFISSKIAPGDFDLVFVYDDSSVTGDALTALRETVLSYSYCKARYKGDIFVYAESSVRNFPTFCDTGMFDYDKVTQRPKGVIEVTLRKSKTRLS